MSHTDLAPTFLDAVGLKPPPEMTGRSLLPLVGSGKAEGRDVVFLERERHANVRADDLSYPCRAIRTGKYLYIRNLRPDRWPAGDPWCWSTRSALRRRRRSPTKDLILARRERGPSFAPAFPRRFRQTPRRGALRPGSTTRTSFKNVAGHEGLRPTPGPTSATGSTVWMKQTADPRAHRRRGL